MIPRRPSSKVTPSTRRVGTVVGGEYWIKGLLGVGGMGAVYEAEDAVGRAVAVKVLHPHLAEDDVVRARFLREVSVVARIDHPHVVSAVDMGVGDDGACFLVMEHVHGASLAEVMLASAPMNVRRVCDVVGQVLAGLGAVHAVGVVHRDLKPENVLLTVEEGRRDFAKILDFGIAAFTGEAARAPDAELTPIGRVMTTLFYASPEQLTGATTGRDARVDVYAAGVLLFEMLAGHRPFVEKNLVDLCRAITSSPPPPMKVFRRDVPRELEAVVLRALAKDPGARFSCAREMLEALAPFGARLSDDAPEASAASIGDRRQ